MAVMAVACMTANAQNSRHSEGSITLQPMIGISSGNLRGEYKGTNGTIKYDDDDDRTGLAIGAEAEYYTSTHWLSVSAGLMYQQQGWKEKMFRQQRLTISTFPFWSTSMSLKASL